MKKKPETIDAYLAGVEPRQRAVLESLRREIAKAAPDAEECISYEMPSFRLRGRLLVSFAAAKNHCAFYPGARPIAEHAEELKGFETAKGTIRFTPERPLSAGLVRKLVQTRAEERGTDR